MPVNNPIVPDIQYPFDPTGQLLSNRVTNEKHVITASNQRDYHYIVPLCGPVFVDNFIMSHKGIDNVVRVLAEGIDYQFSHWFIGASRGCAKAIYGSVSFMNISLAGEITISYNTLGGNWTLNTPKVIQILADRLHNPRVTSFEQVSGKPNVFPVIDHDWNLTDMVGMTEIVQAINGITGALQNSLTNGFAAHVAQNNPHGTSAGDVGAYSKAEIDAKLGRVPHFSTADELFFIRG